MEHLVDDVVQQKMCDYLEAITAIALRYCNNDPHDAQDLVQSTFMDIFSATTPIKDPHKIGIEFFKKCLLNRFRKNIRDYVNYTPMPVEIDEHSVPYFAGPQHRVDRLVVDAMYMEWLAESIGEDYFTAIALKALGFSEKEIADFTDVPLTLTRTRVRVGYRNARKVIENDARKMRAAVDSNSEEQTALNTPERTRK